MIAVTSRADGDGKTTVAVALAYRLLSEGRRVLLLRVQGVDSKSERATADAVLLASVEGASRSAPVKPAEASQQAGKAGKNVVTIVEASADAAREIASKGGARLVLAVSGLSKPSLKAAQTLAQDLGGAAALAVRAPRDRLADAPSLVADAGLDCLGVLPEDGLLAAPRVSELARSLDATYLYENGDQDQVAEHLMIGSVGADPGQPYFRRHQHKAIITRFDKTDLQLAALDSPPLACLILTGGQQPSPYLLDRVQSEEVPILLTRHETAEAMHALEGVYGATRLGGAEKLERLRRLSAGLDGDRLSALLG